MAVAGLNVLVEAVDLAGFSRSYCGDAGSPPWYSAPPYANKRKRKQDIQSVSTYTRARAHHTHTRVRKGQHFLVSICFPRASVEGAYVGMEHLRSRSGEHTLWNLMGAVSHVCVEASRYSSVSLGLRPLLKQVTSCVPFLQAHAGLLGVGFRMKSRR